MGEAIDRYYLRKQDGPGGAAAAASGAAMGERSLSFAEAEAKPKPKPKAAASPFPEIALNRAVGEEAERPDSRDNELSFGQNAAQLPDSLHQDVDRVAAESEKTRRVLNAITQLLVENGILSLDQIQSRIAKLQGGDSGS